MTKKTFSKKFTETLILLSLPVILYFMEGPLSVYVANSNDFSFHYQDFFYVIAAIGLAVWLILSGICALLPDRLHRMVCTLILYFGVMSYVQDMFLNIKLSEPDGSNMHWDELKSYTIFNTILWLAVLVLFVGFHIVGQKKLQKKYDKVIVGAAGFLTALQLVSVISLLIPAITLAGQAKQQGNYGIVGEGQYEVARNKNIIVFVIDSYGTGQLDYALEHNPDLLSGFQDFTYYDNADSVYPGTFPSMTHMLTGVPAVFDCGSSEYQERAWVNEKTEEYYGKLHDAGYVFRLYSNGGSAVYGNIANLEGLIDNAVAVQLNIDKRTILIRMTKISIYKYVPYLFKPRFEVPSHMFFSLISFEGHRPINCGNSLFYGGLKESGLSFSEEENAIIIQHLDGMHLPNDLASDGSYQPDSTLQETEEGVWLILRAYLEQLKDLGVYDDAAIIITADHGRRDVIEKADDMQIIFFVKPAGQRQEEMTRSSAPISLADFCATMLELAGEDHSGFGTSVFDWKDGDLRERVFYYPETSDEYLQVPGEVFNIYEQYIYTGDRSTLTRHILEDAPDVIIPSPGK